MGVNKVVEYAFEIMGAVAVIAIGGKIFYDMVKDFFKR